MKQHTKSIIFLITAKLLIGTSLSIASGEDPSTTTLAPSKRGTSSALSRDVKTLAVAMPDGTTSALLRAAEVRDDVGRGATITISRTTGTTGALIGVMAKDYTIDARGPGEIVSPLRFEWTPLNEALYFVYKGKISPGIKIVHVSPSIEYKDGVMRFIERDDGLDEISKALNSYVGNQITTKLNSLAKFIRRKQAGFGESLENEALKRIPLVVERIINLLDTTDLGELFHKDVTPIASTLDKIIRTCEKHMEEEDVSIPEAAKLEAVVIEGIDITTYHQLSLQLEKTLRTLGKPKYLSAQKETIRDLIKVAKEPHKAKLTKYLARLHTQSAAFQSQSHPQFNALERGIIIINSLFEGLIDFEKHAHRIRLGEAGKSKWLEDYKDTPLMLADKTSEASMAITTLTTKSKAGGALVTAGDRVRNLDSEARFAASVMHQPIDQLTNTIAQIDAYLGIASAPDVAVAGVSGGGSGGSGGSSLETVGTVTSGTVSDVVTSGTTSGTVSDVVKTKEDQ